MPDHISKEKRSWNMAQIKSKNTSIEVMVRKYLYHHGFRYRKNYKGLPGTPDIFLSKYNLVIFVNGCFWHHHYNCRLSYVPKSKTDYWIKKLNKNVENDIMNERELIQMGYKVITVWECELKECFEYRMKELIEEIHNYERRI